MCGGGKAPRKQAQLPEAPRLPNTGGSESYSNVETQRRRRTAGGTILTSSQGVTDGAATSQKTLLGS